MLLVFLSKNRSVLPTKIFLGEEWNDHLVTFIKAPEKYPIRFWRYSVVNSISAAVSLTRLTLFFACASQAWGLLAERRVFNCSFIAVFVTVFTFCFHFRWQTRLIYQRSPIRKHVNWVNHGGFTVIFYFLLCISRTSSYEVLLGKNIFQLVSLCLCS